MIRWPFQNRILIAAVEGVFRKNIERTLTTAEGHAIPMEIHMHFQRGFAVGAVGTVFPYVWSVEEGRPKLREGWGNMAWWYLNIILGLADMVFVAWMCMQKNLDPSVATEVKIYLRFCVVYYTFATTS